ncbi:MULTISPECIES: aspartate aminotransferase family protein [unclassified Aminobacter]|uniref:aminotransferase family protein n=1 Tax=unclassified Aminobacter TaxID=2644704 RepID=UPI0004673C18|nr:MULTISPECIES: aspartate aminotransferase family protein [unclassified Aminobacter]TWH23991.1 adenosylmethionine-8-amino-7-oxononanoate aminotransferase [Aminobacter sp. J15]
MSSVFYRDFAEQLPLVERADGVWIQDVSGKRYLDGMGSAGVIGIGHGRSEIYEALAAEGQRVSYVYTASFTHPWQEELASSVLSVAPKGMSAVYFVSGGSEANETALKLARQYHVLRGEGSRHKMLARWQSYHGVTIATLSLSGRTSWRAPYDPYMLPVVHVSPPYNYRCNICNGTGDCTDHCIEELERTILLEGPETISCFFAETIVGTTASGVTPGPDYYRRVREICDRYGILFIADEVLIGYGRTGRPFAIEDWGVLPDMITCGKAIGSGYAPLGAVIVSDKIAGFFRDGQRRFVHGFTYSGHAMSCFVGQKVFEIMQREDLFARPGRIGSYLHQRLGALQQRHPAIGDVRGRGLYAGVEFVSDRATREPFPEAVRFTTRLVGMMRDRGVIVGGGVPGSNYGKGGDHIQISPPFTISETEIDVIVDTLDEVLTVLSAEIGGRE